MKILIFIIANIVGFISLIGIFSYAAAQGLVPDTISQPFRTAFFNGTSMALLVGAFLSVAYLFIGNILRLLFLALPIICPVVYALYILNLYN